ncbi:MAG: hypothetical protein JW888_06040 [Pirellulales bacterium]|nr:hypothetical protein [Pirellulales bacterium]
MTVDGVVAETKRKNTISCSLVQKEGVQLATYWGSGPTATWDQGDFDHDGFVGPRDASILAANWGYTSSPFEASAVPEPSMAILLLTLPPALLLKRRR